jgi:hypothetical protein
VTRGLAFSVSSVSEWFIASVQVPLTTEKQRTQTKHTENVFISASGSFNRLHRYTLTSLCKVLNPEFAIRNPQF